MFLIICLNPSLLLLQKKNKQPLPLLLFVSITAFSHWSRLPKSSASAWFYRRNNQVHSPHFNILACKIECCLKILAFAVFFFITLFWTHTKACRNRRRYLLAVYQPVISVSIFLKMWDALTLDIIMSTAMFCIKLDFLYCPLNYSGASDHGYMSLQRKWTPNGLLLE